MNPPVGVKGLLGGKSVKEVSWIVDDQDGDLSWSWGKRKEDINERTNCSTKPNFIQQVLSYEDTTYQVRNQK